MTPINQFFSLLLTLSLCMPFGIAQTDQTGMPGDNFSLEGTLELFKKAKSPEHFEELLNKPESKSVFGLLKFVNSGSKIVFHKA